TSEFPHLSLHDALPIFIIMAAGLGKRMKSSLAKVLHPVAGRPMVLYVLDIACGLAEQGVAVVVGHQGAEVRKVIEAVGGQVAVRSEEHTSELQSRENLV